MFRTHRWRKIIYSAWAPVYDLMARPAFARMRQASVARLCLAAGERLLIVGAGTGLDLELIPRGVDVTAIDLTPAMLRRLDVRAMELGISVNVRAMDAQRMTFADAAFDAAILHLILSVIPDPVACLRETARVLRPGGRAVVLDKFVPDADPVPVGLRVLNPFVSFFGTEIDRKLEPIVTASELSLVSNDPAGLRGFYRSAVLRKGGAGASGGVEGGGAGGTDGVRSGGA